MGGAWPHVVFTSPATISIGYATLILNIMKALFTDGSSYRAHHMRFTSFACYVNQALCHLSVLVICCGVLSRSCWSYSERAIVLLQRGTEQGVDTIGMLKIIYGILHLGIQKPFFGSRRWDCRLSIPGFGYVSVSVTGVFYGRSNRVFCKFSGELISIKRLRQKVSILY